MMDGWQGATNTAASHGSVTGTTRRSNNNNFKYNYKKESGTHTHTHTMNVE
jgi:hypothetical protein